MAKHDQNMEWFGADVEERETPRVKETATEFHGGKFVDAKVETQVRNRDTGEVVTRLVHKPAPKYLRAKTTSVKDADIARATARFKLMREGFQFAPASDKEMWEKRRDIAYAEMQIVRFRAKLARYEATENPRPEQVRLLKDTVAKWRGYFAELTGQA